MIKKALTLIVAMDGLTTALWGFGFLRWLRFWGRISRWTSPASRSSPFLGKTIDRVVRDRGEDRSPVPVKYFTAAAKPHLGRLRAWGICKITRRRVAPLRTGLHLAPPV